MTTNMRDRSTMTMRGLAGRVLALVLGAGAVTAGSCKGGGDGPEAAPGPGYGKDDSGDAADLECRVVLRSLAPKEDDANKLVGLLDAEAAEVDAGGKPNLLFTFQIGAGDGAAFQQLPDNAFKEVGGGLE